MLVPKTDQAVNNKQVTCSLMTQPESKAFTDSYTLAHLPKTQEMLRNQGPVLTLSCFLLSADTG